MDAVSDLNQEMWPMWPLDPVRQAEQDFSLILERLRLASPTELVYGLAVLQRSLERESALWGLNTTCVPPNSPISVSSS